MEEEEADGWTLEEEVMGRGSSSSSNSSYWKSKYDIERGSEKERKEKVGETNCCLKRK